MIDIIRDQEIYQKVILDKIPETQNYLWIATADIKDLHISFQGKFVPFLKLLAWLLENRKEVRLIHAKEPGPAFRKDFDRYPMLAQRLERLLCPKTHFKAVIIDGKFAYTGSANLTGAGMGAKSNSKRNFESGAISDEPWFIDKVQKQFDDVWMGAYCDECAYKKTCPDRDAMNN